MDEPSQPAVRGELVLRQVDEDFLVYDPISDRVVVLNVSAAVVFGLCDGIRTPPGITAEVTRIFGSDVPSIPRDVQDALKQFLDNGLLKREAS